MGKNKKNKKTKKEKKWELVKYGWKVDRKIRERENKLRRNYFGL